MLHPGRSGSLRYVYVCGFNSSENVQAESHGIITDPRMMNTQPTHHWLGMQPYSKCIIRAQAVIITGVWRHSKRTRAGHRQQEHNGLDKFLHLCAEQVHQYVLHYPLRELYQRMDNIVISADRILIGVRSSDQMLTENAHLRVCWLSLAP